MKIVNLFCRSFQSFGGASGVGKTSLAINLASVLDIPRVVATDDIRQIMRLMLAPDLMPSIHDSSYAAQAPDIPVIEASTAEEVTSAAVMVVAESLQEQGEMQKALSSGTGKKKKKA